jgi:hypothetical protein
VSPGHYSMVCSGVSQAMHIQGTATVVDWGKGEELEVPEAQGDQEALLEYLVRDLDGAKCQFCVVYHDCVSPMSLAGSPGGV